MDRGIDTWKASVDGVMNIIMTNNHDTIIIILIIMTTNLVMVFLNFRPNLFFDGSRNVIRWYVVRGSLHVIRTTATSGCNY
jgi:hypothetical protein